MALYHISQKLTGHMGQLDWLQSGPEPLTRDPSWWTHLVSGLGPQWDLSKGQFGQNFPFWAVLVYSSSHLDG